MIIGDHVEMGQVRFLQLSHAETISQSVISCKPAYITCNGNQAY